MTVLITCRTRFDITATGVRGNFNRHRLPFTDQAGQQINDTDQWHRSRNQQRNWETFTQLIALRALPTNITPPTAVLVEQDRTWIFAFEIEDLSQVSTQDTPLKLLYQDCQGVPMLVGLSETVGLEPMISIGSNTDFEHELL